MTVYEHRVGDEECVREDEAASVWRGMTEARTLIAPILFMRAIWILFEAKQSYSNEIRPLIHTHAQRTPTCSSCPSINIPEELPEYDPKSFPALSL